MKKILTSAFCLLSLVSVFAQAPTKASILKTANLVNDYFMKIWPDPTTPTFVKKGRPSSLWTRAVYYEGLMALQQIDPQKRNVKYIDDWANFHKWTPMRGTSTVNADNQCCGQTYLDRYEQQGCKDAWMIDSVRFNLDKQMATGRVDYWTWIDAIQMAMPVYSKMFRLTGDPKYIFYARDSYEWTRNKCGGGCFNKREGLWWRDADYVAPYKEKDGNNCYWSRGNGWVVVALIKAIDDIDANLDANLDPNPNLNLNPNLNAKDLMAIKAFRKELTSDYLAMMKALKKCQRADGFWNPSLVCPANYGGKETSGTALFIAGMAWGVRKGLLKADEYKPVIFKAWKAICKDAIHDNGFIGYLQGTGKDPSAGQPVTYNSIPDFEDYGTGCVLLAASEIYKMIR